MSHLLLADPDREFDPLYVDGAVHLVAHAQVALDLDLLVGALFGLPCHAGLAEIQGNPGTRGLGRCFGSGRRRWWWWSDLDGRLGGSLLSATEWAHGQGEKAGEESRPVRKHVEVS
jgi:hypothetical protein